VGVAAEAIDDGFVAQLEVQVVLYAQLRKQRHRLRVHHRRVFDEVLLGGELFEPEVEDGLRLQGDGEVGWGVSIDFI
jgi:hypothetical protein